MSKFLTTQQIIAKYGQPGDMKNLVTIPAPYPLRIAWDLKTVVNKITVHKLIADRVRVALAEVLNHYGLPALQEMGLDIFGGCFNYRKMIGGNYWSRHSWGIALDFDPDHNKLKWGKDKARFAKPEYKKFFEIMEKHGFVGLGPLKNYDWMHIETIV